MFYSKRIRKTRRKPGWYSSQYRPHFDRRLDFETVKRLVEDKGAVERHFFMPTITFTKTERRYRSSGQSEPRAKLKTRPLAYVSNKDGYIYAFYASSTQTRYDILLKDLGLDDVVIGYRKGKSNITLAKDAFDEIVRRGSCSAIALDIRSFFDNIDHSILRKGWAKVLSVPHLSPDHYSVYAGLTKSPGISLKDCMLRLGLPSKTAYRDLPRPLCSIEDFRQKICSKDFSLPSLVSSRPIKGIPQGTPISAVAANISMLDFDVAMAAEARRVGGSYRRYSDDILLICPSHISKRLETSLKASLVRCTRTLRIAPEKTNRVTFSDVGVRVSGRPLQYLGFNFDGVQRHLRSGTVSRFQQRMASAVRRAKWTLAQVEKGKLHGRDAVHRKSLYTEHTHLGADSFSRGYGKLARQKIGPNSIKQQLRGTQKLLHKMIERD